MKSSIEPTTNCSQLNLGERIAIRYYAYEEPYSELDKNQAPILEAPLKTISRNLIATPYN